MNDNKTLKRVARLLQVALLLLEIVHKALELYAHFQ